MNKFTIYCFFLFIISNLNGQDSGIPFGNDAFQIMDRLEIKTGIATPFHSSLKQYSRGDVTNYAMIVDSFATNLSELDKEDLNYIYRDNNEWLGLTKFLTILTGVNEAPKAQAQAQISLNSPQYQIRTKPILKHFYKTPAIFFEVDKDFFT